MTNPATNDDKLKKRVVRFLTREQSRDSHLAALLHSLKNVGEVYIFGGLLRDITLNGIQSKKSDIDLVFTGSKSRLISILNDYNVVTNKFGGHRILTQHWQVDIWKASESWAFKSGNRPYRNIESLLSTTITSWDSILFDINRSDVIARKSYFEDIESGFLDLVLTENPNKLGMGVKLFRALSDERVKLMSFSVSTAVHDLLAEFGLERFLNYEREHYKSSYVDAYLIQQINNCYARNKIDLLPLDVPHASENLLLFAN